MSRENSLKYARNYAILRLITAKQEKVRNADCGLRNLGNPPPPTRFGANRNSRVANSPAQQVKAALARPHSKTLTRHPWRITHYSFAVHDGVINFW
jgi:hypothetical protein